MTAIGYRLEQYTLKRPQEVLLITARVGEELDQVTVFKGFSSSLVRPTAFDPDVPVLSDDAEIVSVDRLESPYNPQSPRYIQSGLTLAEMESLLEQLGV